MLYQEQKENAKIENAVSSLIALSHRTDLYPSLIDSARVQYHGKEYDQSPYERALAAVMIDRAEWCRRQGDVYSYKFVLRRMVARYPETLSAERARGILSGS